MGGSNATRKKIKSGKSGTETGCCSAMRNALSRLFCGAPDECRVVKMMLGFPVGLLLGAGLYLCLIRPMRLPDHLRDSLGAILGFSIALGFALSVQVRCVSLLVIPVFFGKKGRSYIATYAIAYLISGPVSNIIFNAGEATRALSCTAKLMANHSKAKMDLRVGPLRDIMVELKEDGFRLKKVISEIDKTFGPIRKESQSRCPDAAMNPTTTGWQTDRWRTRTDNLPTEQQTGLPADGPRGIWTCVHVIRGSSIFGDRETRDLKGKTDKMDNTLGGGHRSGKIENRYHDNVGETEAVKDERKYEKKLDYRCEDVFSMGAVHCREKFRALEQNCLNKMPWVGRLLCLPLKLTIICELVKSVPNIIGLDCNSMEVVSPGLGEAYDVADKTTAEFDKSFDVDLKYKVEYSRENIDVVTAKEVTLGIEQEFAGRQRWMDFCLTFFHRMLAFTFLLVFKVAYNYHNQYVSNMQYDNNYVTSYFRKIDARRRAEGKRTLLPLKKLEEKEVLVPWSMSMRSTEKRKLMKGTLKLFINIFVIMVIVLVDRMFYSVLEIIQRHSRIEYRQQGVHEIDIKIYGNGFVANLVRHILKGFSQKHSIDNITTNFECLPQPVTVDVRTLYVIFGIHVAVWILMLLESYGLRLRRAIASFFYRKREKTRILYFYNDLLKRRKGFLQHARHRVKSLARKRRLSKRSGVLLSLRRRFPRLCSCLSVMSSARERCLVCDDPEDKNFVRCITRSCEVGYCQECWIDIKKRCYACMPDEEWEDTSTATEIDTE